MPEEPSSPPLRVLILGGSTEASELAAILASRRDVAATLSLAGRVREPAPQRCRFGSAASAAFMVWQPIFVRNASPS